MDQSSALVRFCPFFFFFAERECLQPFFLWKWRHGGTTVTKCVIKKRIKCKHCVREAGRRVWVKKWMSYAMKTQRPSFSWSPVGLFLPSSQTCAPVSRSHRKDTSRNIVRKKTSSFLRQALSLNISTNLFSRKNVCYNRKTTFWQ